MNFLRAQFENEFFKSSTLKMYFLREKFQICFFWGGSFENLFFEGANLKEYNEE